VIAGTNVTPPEDASTVRLFDALDKQLVPEMAFAVITMPAERVKPLIVQFVPVAVIVPIDVVPPNKTMVAPDADVPVTEVLLVVRDDVVITGAAVCVVGEPTQT
jgi:hypothetical protein